MKKTAETAAKVVGATKGRRPGRASRPASESAGSPSARDLAWYHEWAVKHRRQTVIATEAGVPRQTVHRAVRAVDEWLRTQLIDDVLSFRCRQTEALEQVAADCLEKWNATKELGYLEEFRKLLADLRRMWGVDKPQKLEVIDTDADGLERVAGRTRADAIRAQAAALLAALESGGDHAGQSA